MILVALPADRLGREFRKATWTGDKHSTTPQKDISIHLTDESGSTRWHFCNAMHITSASRGPAVCFKDTGRTGEVSTFSYIQALLRFSPLAKTVMRPVRT